MKKMLVVSALSLILIALFVPRTTSAAFGFGGTVLTTYVSGVVCTGEGPVFIFPKGTAPAGPYAPSPFTLRYKNYFIRPGISILGTYLPFMIPGLCWTTTPIPLPVPVFPILTFGVSK